MAADHVPKPPKLPGGQRHDELFNPRKLFVGGVSKSVGQEEFREYWKQFGELEDCVVMVVCNTKLKHYQIAKLTHCKIAKLQNYRYPPSSCTIPILAKSQLNLIESD